MASEIGSDWLVDRRLTLLNQRRDGSVGWLRQVPSLTSPVPSNHLSPPLIEVQCCAPYANGDTQPPGVRAFARMVRRAKAPADRQDVEASRAISTFVEFFVSRTKLLNGVDAVVAIPPKNHGSRNRLPGMFGDELERCCALPHLRDVLTWRRDVAELRELSVAPARGAHKAHD